MSADATALRASRSMPWSRVMGLTSIYAKTVRDSRRAALIVGFVGGLLMLTTAAAYATEFATPEARANLVAQMTSLPAVFQGLLGTPIALEHLGGYVSWRVGNILVVMLGLWSVIALSGTLAGESARGSLDLVASTPISRPSLAVQKLLGHVTALAVAMLIAAVLTWLAGVAFASLPGDEIPFTSALGWAMLMGLLILACGSVAFALAPYLGRTRAAVVGMVVLFGGYVLDSYATLSDVIGALAPLSWFHWTASHRPLAGVSDWPAVALLAAVTVVLLAIGVVAFARRDLGGTSGLARVRLPGLPAGTRGPIGRQLWDRAGLAIGFGLGLGVYGAAIASSATQFADVIDQIPEVRDYLQTIFPNIDLHQPSALLQLAFYSFGTLLIGLAGAAILAGWSSDETEGRLDTVLSAPISRAGWFVRTGLGVYLAIAVATAVVAILLAVSVLAVGGAIGDVIAGTAILGLAAAAFTGIGLAAGGLRRLSVAAPVTAVVVLATFLLDLIGTALHFPDAIVELSLTTHLGQPLVGTYDPVGIVAAVALAVAGLAIGAWGFQRRDIDR
ncbi:MAG: ABC transporter permease subunit [Acidimicrobiales bacterium]